MPTITAVFANPDVVRHDAPDAVWFINGVGTAANLDAYLAANDTEGLMAEYGDAALTRIPTGDDPTVTLTRALFSSHDIFWAIRTNGDIVIGDHIRNVLAHLDITERAPSDLTLAAHYLSRKPHGSLTISGSVQRMEFGHRVDIEARTGAVTKTQIGRVVDTSVTAPKEEYLAAVDEALRATLGDIHDPASTALMFSGGVDSTLVLALDPTAMVPVTFVPDTPEFGVETGYARTAAELMGIDPVEVPVEESRFVEYLEDSIDAVGVPVYSDAGPYYHQCYSLEGYDTFVDGHGADSSFGASLKLARFSNAFRHTPSRQVLEQLAPRVPGHLGYRLDQVSSRASGLAKDPWDPDGWAGDTRTYGDQELLGSIFGPETIAELKQRQLDLVGQLVEGVGTNPDTFMAHIDIHHWMTVFAGTMMQARLNTTALGKRAIGPYCDWRVLSVLTTVPLEERYVVGLRAKWMLKELLKAKVPNYPIDQRKKATALPWKRFYTNGPLTGIWDRYDVPDIFSGDLERHVTETPTAATWSAIAHAIWNQRIAKNPNLTTVGKVNEYTRSVG